MPGRLRELPRGAQLSSLPSSGFSPSLCVPLDSYVPEARGRPPGVDHRAGFLQEDDARLVSFVPTPHGRSLRKQTGRLSPLREAVSPPPRLVCTHAACAPASRSPLHDAPPFALHARRTLVRPTRTPPVSPARRLCRLPAQHTTPLHAARALPVSLPRLLCVDDGRLAASAQCRLVLFAHAARLFAPPTRWPPPRLVREHAARAHAARFRALHCVSPASHLRARSAHLVCAPYTRLATRLSCQRPHAPTHAFASAAGFFHSRPRRLRFARAHPGVILVCGRAIRLACPLLASPRCAAPSPARTTTPYVTSSRLWRPGVCSLAVRARCVRVANAGTALDTSVSPSRRRFDAAPPRRRAPTTPCWSFGRLIVPAARGHRARFARPSPSSRRPRAHLTPLTAYPLSRTPRPLSFRLPCAHDARLASAALSPLVRTPHVRPHAHSPCLRTHARHSLRPRAHARTPFLRSSCARGAHNGCLAACSVRAPHTPSLLACEDAARPFAPCALASPSRSPVRRTRLARPHAARLARPHRTSRSPARRTLVRRARRPPAPRVPLVYVFLGNVASTCPPPLVVAWYAIIGKTEILLIFHVAGFL
ncbi:hypothetical protein B0H14DRAFT_3604135 [Mycena olivaceomarginata]|nr:hypothetical protein B0H14DRAFT_3604135 [Mycena olivaceomarginata]